MIRTLVFGSGRMAKCLLELADEFPRIDYVAVVSPSTLDSNRRMPPYFPTLDDAAAAMQRPLDLVIDFTLPEGTATVARWCAGHKVALLSGVTGIGDDVDAALDEAARTAPVLWAPNLSFGVNLMAELLSMVGARIDASAPVTIEEVHHAGKVDSPSGTALMLADDLQGSAADDLSIEFNSRREGEVVGDHSVTIDLPDERLVLSHHAADRRLFARGALRAAQWLVQQPPGRYTAADWIRGTENSHFAGANGQP